MESSLRVWLWLIGAVCLLSSVYSVNGTLVENLIRVERYASPDPYYAKINGTTWVKRDTDTKIEETRTSTIPTYELDLNKSNNAKESVTRRGKVKFFSKIQSSSQSPLRRKIHRNNEVTTIRYQEKKTPSEIIDSMRDYKSKLSSPVPVFSTDPSIVEELTEDNSEDDSDFDISKYVSDDFHDISNVYTLPSFSDNDATYEGSQKVIKKIEFDKFKVSEEDEFGSFPSKSHRFKPMEDFTTLHSPYFGPLTTPRNDFFDKRFKDVSQSIINNLDVHKKDKNHKRIYGETITNNLKLRDSMSDNLNSNPKIFYHNRKQITLTDKEQKGNGKKELSDVEGTSIYYELSMVSTENYGQDYTTEVDCDNETIPLDTTTTPKPTTKSTTSSRKPYITPTIPSVVIGKRPPSTNRPFRARPIISSFIPKSTTTRKSITLQTLRQNTIETTLKPKSTTSWQNTQENTSKPSRKIQYTSPKSVSKVRMSPRRNTTRPSKLTEYKNEIPSESQRKQLLTTLSTDIDPIYQEDTEGANKIVDSKIISDNSLPVLRKRGSMKYKATTESTPGDKVQEEIIMAIPPTSSAWALAGMINPPSNNFGSSSSKSETHSKLADNTISNKQIVTPNEADQQHQTLTTTSSAEPSTEKIEISNEEFLSWKPIMSPPTTESQEITSETNQNMHIVFASPVNNYPTGFGDTQTPLSETLTTRETKRDITTTFKLAEESLTIDDWIPAANLSNDYNLVFSSQMTRESITKLPNNLTTPIIEEESVTSTTGSTWTSSEPQTSTTTVIYEDGSKSFMAFTNSGKEMSSEGTTVAFDTDISYTMIANETIQTEQPTTTEKEVEFSTEIIREETTTFAPIIETTTSNWVLAENKDKIETVSTDIIPITTYRPYYSTIDNQQQTDAEITTNFIIPSTFSSSTSDSPPKATEVPTEITTQSVSKETTELSAKEITTTKNIITTLRSIAEDDINNKEISEVTNMELNKTSESPKVFESSTEVYLTTPRSVNDPEDLMTSFSVEPDADKSLDQETSGAAIAIAVSTIGIIALVLLFALLLVLRRRNNRGVYAQRCTPVSLDAYSLDSVSVGRNKKGASKLRASKRSYGNPTFNDEEVVISHSMQYQALLSFALDHDSMANEFTEIPTTIVKADEIPPGCEDKNRYSNIVPLPETRVPLRRLNDDPRTEYINANYVPGPGNIRNYYIACQAPMANTVIDFWRMIWEQNSRVIVMLTEYMENGVEKCYEYIPPNEVSDNKRRFGDFEVILKRRDQKDRYAISNIQVRNHVTKSWREIFHLWYFWPAKGVPEDHDSVIDFLLEMRSYMRLSQNSREFDEDGLDHIDGESGENLTTGGSDLNVYSPKRAEERMTNGASNGTLSRMKAAERDGSKVRPLTVVCASGCGRSGAVIVLELCARALDTTGTVDVPRAVRIVREARPHALPNKQHYIFVYKVLSEYGNKLMGGNVDSI